MWKPQLASAANSPAETLIVMQAVASFDADSLQAGKDGRDGKDGKKRLLTLTMRAHSGGLMKPTNYSHSVVVDLIGVKHDGRVPIFLDHEVSGRGLVGHADVLVGEFIGLAGVVSGATEAAQTVVNSAKQGFEWQCSIGCEVEKKTFVDDDDSRTINGREHTGPFYHIESSRLIETHTWQAGRSVGRTGHAQSDPKKRQRV